MLKIIEKPVLPKDYFSVEVKPQLLAQAVRVYLANQRQGTQSALTRAEVNRTRKKIYRQKGTGHARHGDRKAPIYVGGGIAFAPKPRDYSLSLSSPMRQKAKLGALSQKAAEKKLLVADGLNELSGKTKQLNEFLVSVNKDAKSWLIITDSVHENILRAGRNLSNVELSPANLINTYQILKADYVLLMPEAVTVLTGKEQVKPVKSVKSVKPVKTVKTVKKTATSKKPKK